MAAQSLRGVGERKVRTSREEADVQMAGSRAPTPIPQTPHCPLVCEAVLGHHHHKGVTTDDG